MIKYWARAVLKRDSLACKTKYFLVTALIVVQWNSNFRRNINSFVQFNKVRFVLIDSSNSGLTHRNYSIRIETGRNLAIAQLHVCELLGSLTHSIFFRLGLLFHRPLLRKSKMSSSNYWTMMGFRSLSIVVDLAYLWCPFPILTCSSRNVIRPFVLQLYLFFLWMISNP